MASPQNHPVASIFDLLARTDLDAVLKKWTGEKIYMRGLNYFRSGNVASLVVTRDGKLRATVHGTRNYSAVLYLDEAGRLAGECNCPYEDNCKHLVAIVLEARKAIRGASGAPCDIDPRALADYVKNAVASHAYAPYFGKRHKKWPDYMEIAKKLKDIVESGQPEIVMDLARDVFSSCENAIETCAYNREVMDGVFAVTETVVEALEKLDWTSARKLLWAIDVLLRNRWTCNTNLSAWLDEISDSSAWTGAAAHLARLEEDGSCDRKKAVRRLSKLAQEKLLQ